MKERIEEGYRVQSVHHILKRSFGVRTGHPKSIVQYGIEAVVTLLPHDF